MMTGKSAWTRMFVVYSLAVFGELCCVASANAQRRYGETIDAGTQVAVRTTEPINATNSDGREFLGVVDQDVINRNGDIAIPRGSDANLIVRRTGNDEITVDLDSITVSGQTYGIATSGTEIDTGRGQGIGANGRTGQYVGGGAVIGAIIGAIVGGGKGAAIGAGAGAAAGAGTQVLTRGRRVVIPAEALLTFNLQQPLRIGMADNRFSRDGHWYQQGYGSSPSSAYLRGVQDGGSDASRQREDNWRPNQWTNDQARRDYSAGYTRGYGEHATGNGASQTYGLRPSRTGITIGTNNNISWQAPGNVRVYVQVDNQRAQLFAQGPSGTQPASWMSRGHLYVFTMRDDRGNELAKEQLDLRQSSGRPGANR